MNQRHQQLRSALNQLRTNNYQRQFDNDPRLPLMAAAIVVHRERTPVRATVSPENTSCTSSRPTSRYSPSNDDGIS